MYRWLENFRRAHNSLILHILQTYKINILTHLSKSNILSIVIARSLRISSIQQPADFRSPVVFLFIYFCSKVYK